MEFDWNGDGVFDTIAGTPAPNRDTPSIVPPSSWLLRIRRPQSRYRQN